MKSPFHMKNIALLVLLSSLAVACSQGDSKPQEKSSEAKEIKEELDAARKEYQALREKIDKLEGDLKKADPAYAKESDKAILVSSFVPSKSPFEHRVEVRGSVASRKNVLITAQNPGTIEKVHVKEGQRVTKGQLLISQDADVIRSNIKELKTSLELANTLYERQSRLWEQKIGTEVQYLQAKNNKESLESKLAATNAQLDQSIIRAPFNGTIDEVPAREGEIAAPGVPLVRITSPEDMFIQGEVSERFLGKVAPGDKVEIYFPVLDQTLESTISSVSNIINPENRTFRVEVNLPKTSSQLKPNQVTILEIRDYFKKETFSIPTRLILKDNSGEYVYGIDKANSTTVAKKIRVKSGVTYDGKTEILEGLTGNEELIDKGFRDVAEDVEVAITTGGDISEVAKYNK